MRAIGRGRTSFLALCVGLEAPGAGAAGVGVVPGAITSAADGSASPTFLHRPRSVSLMWPRRSSRMLSGLRSLHAQQVGSVSATAA